MFNRLATVLQELSGEEAPDGDPQLPVGEGQGPVGWGEDANERLAHLEPLVVQLKELIRDKDAQLAHRDAQLAHKDAQIQNEKETADLRFTKLKLQAKAKMASLTKQMNDMKGQEGTTSPDTSFTAAEAEAELQALRSRLSQEEASSRDLRQQLQTSQQLLQEKETTHGEQLRVLQAVVFEKDVCFQEQIQKQEDELLRVAAQSQTHGDLQQALHLSQRRCKDLEEAMRSRSQELELLQQEVGSADQQKQILTAQFRQMEQELLDAGRHMEEERRRWALELSGDRAELEAFRSSSAAWEKEKAEVARLEMELASIREAENEALGASQEALEKEKMEVARLEMEVASLREAENRALGTSQGALEKEKAEVAKLERELAVAMQAIHDASESSGEARLERELTMKEAEVADIRAAQERTCLDNGRLEQELAELRAEKGENQKQGELLAELWHGLCSLTGSVHGGETGSTLTEPSVVLGTLQDLEALVATMKQERDKSEETCTQLTRAVESLHEQLNTNMLEQEENADSMQKLEGQTGSMSNESVLQHVIEPSEHEAEKAHILSLEQQLLEKANELAAMRECLSLAQKLNPPVTTAVICDQTQEQVSSSTAAPEGLEDTPEEETTLVAEDNSVLSVSADHDSSPELIRPPSDSPGESKGASSDEMVTSTDSEVAHSSWTLLDAVNQDGSQEWPPVLQDFGQLQLQSWEETSVEQEASTVHVESSSIIIRETVQVQLSQQGGSSSTSALSSGQVFALGLAEELQNRYSELLAELQRLRETSTQSQERVLILEKERNLLVSAKEEAGSQVRNVTEDLQSAREELEKLSQQSSSTVEKYTFQIKLLEDEITILQADDKTKEHEIEVLQSNIAETQHSLFNQEVQARTLCAQLEDRQRLSSELEQKLQEMENSLLAYSQTTDINNASLVEKDAEINQLQIRLSQKEQEMLELSESMSEETSEVKQLKEQIYELEKVREQGTEKVNSEDAVNDKLGVLQKEKDELGNQLANMKKKFQVVLLQRKELMKKVAEFDDAKKHKEKDDTAAVVPHTTSPVTDQDKGPEIQKVETMLNNVEQALKCKEQDVESLEQRISQQDQALSESLALNTKLSEEAERLLHAGSPDETTKLQSQLASLQAECEMLHKKLSDAQDSRKETIRKAKEKDRHHREQLKQQKEEYNNLLERFEGQSAEHNVLLAKLNELKDAQAQNNVASEKEALKREAQQKPDASVWVQEEWDDFAEPERDSAGKRDDEPIQHHEHYSKVVSSEMETLTEECQASPMASTELEEKLHAAQTALIQKEIELLEMGKELEGFRERERQADILSEEIHTLREKIIQAESYAETIKLEVEAAAKAASESSLSNLQAEVEDFKLFIDKKNQEIMELSQQLSDQNTLLRAMQTTVSEKDQLIVSLQELKAEQEKALRLEAEAPQKQEEEKDSKGKIQQLQRKLQAALISRKEALKENKTLKEQIASNEKVIAEMKENTEVKKAELEKLRAERVKLIEDVDQTLLENQSLSSSCESLKLAMEGILSEKDACQRDIKFAKEEAASKCRELEEKVQGMKEEYETLLKSYENVSDEAERVRLVLEAARQERQELAAKIRAHEFARQEAERQVEEARKEVDLVKDKMRKFAKTKQQKILDLEEENERLRDMEEKKGIKQKQGGLPAELERLQIEREALKVNLDATVAERDSLVVQVAELTETIAQQAEKEKGQTVFSLNSGAVGEQSIVAQQSETLMAHTTIAGTIDGQSQEQDEFEAKYENPNEGTAVVSVAGAHGRPTEQMIATEGTEKPQTPLEDKIRDMEAVLSTERELRQEREVKLSSLEQQLQEMQEKDQSLEASLQQCLQEVKEKEQRLQEVKEKEQSLEASLQQCLQEVKEKEQCIIEERSKKEAQLKELRRGLEAEKDDLEERLMNQLARLNGSMAGYQQEAADTRERLAELQREVEMLERERAELEAQAQSEMSRAARLEEDKRQAQRERAEAEAESGKHRELEQQLRSAQRVKEGSQNRARQLEELLREKQLEMRQLQNDCIKYQGRISELGRETKAQQLGREELQKQVDQSRLESSKALERLRSSEAELVDCKSQLDEARTKAREALAEKAAIEQSALQREVALKSEAEQTLDSVRFRLGAELKEIELRLEEAYTEREKEEEATMDAREMAAAAERRAQEMQAGLDESLARLAAFSRSMSSLQDDRDRVLDEVRQWETRFNNTLQGKESEVREGESRVKELSEQLQKETSLKEKLQSAVERLEKSNKEWQSRLEDEEKKVSESQAALDLERGTSQDATAQWQSFQTKAHTLESEVEGLRQRSLALEEAAGMLQGEMDRARTELVEREAEERRLRLHVEQLETDLRSSKSLTESLQTELSEKERREVELLGEKEQAVAQAAEEARQEADGRAQLAEGALEQRRGELRELEDQLRQTKEESNRSKARLDSFMKAMGSLQDDRDRILVTYKQLEEKHLQVMMEKDVLIQEAAGENNGLKEELRSLLAQRDDLYAERAKLAAQLHGYREELNQVLTMKDSQHRQVLAAQREHIASLERQRQELEARIQSLGGETETKAAEGGLERETLSRSGDGGGVLVTVVDAPGAEVEKLREQLQAAKEQAEALEESLLKERQEQAARRQKLAELQWEDGVMRTESENAQERVAELARDLLLVEQKLLEEREVAAQLRAENQAFGKAMSSLQDSREQVEMKFQKLSLRLEELSKAEGQPVHSSPTGEVWSLKNALQALQNDRERLLEQLDRQAGELQKHKSELVRLGAGELIKVSQELFDERLKAEEMLGVIKQLEATMDSGKQEIETLRLERIDCMVQAEQLKQQTLATLSERDQQLRQLNAMLEEAHTSKPRALQESYQREGMEDTDSAPGAPQERGGPPVSHIQEVKELQLRLDEEMEQRAAAEEQLMVARDQLQRCTQGEWLSAREAQHSETAVLIEPPAGALSQTRRGSPSLRRMLRVAFCSRQRTPLLLSLYLLTVHVLLLLCLGGYL